MGERGRMTCNVALKLVVIHTYIHILVNLLQNPKWKLRHPFFEDSNHFCAHVNILGIAAVKMCLEWIGLCVQNMPIGLGSTMNMIRRTCMPTKWTQGSGRFKVCGCYLVCFYVLHLLSIIFTRWNLCCIKKSTMKRLWIPNWKSLNPLSINTMKHLFKPNWKSDLPSCSYGYQNCMLLK